MFWSPLVLLLLSLLARGAPAPQAANEDDADSVSPSSARSSTRTQSQAGSSTPFFSVSAKSQAETVAPVTNDPNRILWTIEDPRERFDPIRGMFGAPILGPQNVDLERQNADLFNPPSSDSGSVPNVKWPFALSHNRVQAGGWARQQNENVLPVAKNIAGVNMRLLPGAIRELHWHNTAEWAYVLKGQAQITVMNARGQNYLANVDEGDLWYFPPGLPHSVQGTSKDPGGTEFLLVFPTGAFSEDSTFMVTDWMGHVPKDVLAENFQVNISKFDHIPDHALWIFPSLPPPINAKAIVSPDGAPPDPFSFELSKVKATQLPGGNVKIVDSTTFKVSKEIALAEIEVEPGAIRELHWHPTDDEWSFFVEGEARVTIFASGDNSRTFNYQAGDVGYVPASFGHYVQNIGNTTLKFLEIFKTDRFEDISLNQWLALTPPDMVKAHLGFDDETIDALQKQKPTVNGPRSN